MAFYKKGDKFKILYGYNNKPFNLTFDSHVNLMTGGNPGRSIDIPHGEIITYISTANNGYIWFDYNGKEGYIESEELKNLLNKKIIVPINENRIKEQKLRNLVREQIKQVLKEWFPHKEEFRMFEDLYEVQEQIYNDAADVGITPQHKDFSKIKPAIQSMVNTYGSKNFKWSGGWSVSIFVPIEMNGDMVSGYELKVSFNKDSKLKTIYKKPYDAFFSIDNLERIIISKEDAVKKYNCKQFKKSEGVMKEEKDKFWMGTVNDTDDFQKPIKDEFIDGKTIYGPWGIMSPESFKQFGVGIGLGKGQWYKKQPDGQWKKIKG